MPPRSDWPSCSVPEPLVSGGFHTITLGCKANQFDSAAIDGELVRRGFDRREHYRDADVVVVNTCTVTHRADADARRLIRAVRRANPACTLMVTGCYAQLDPEILRAMPEVDGVFGNDEKQQWPEILDGLGLPTATDSNRVQPDRGCDGMPNAAGLYFGSRTRAFLKVQDGCRLACSYCVIPTVRGASRSVPTPVVVDAFTGLLRRGYREVVLTGINTGDYGRDLEDGSTLATLLRTLLSVAGSNRIRLNSLEPLTVTDEVIELLADHPRLASHLQMPLQSGSPAVLRAMRRNYRLETYSERLETLATRVPDIALGADVIVGFPGETDAQFEETFRFVRDSPLCYLHVFSWSPRQGTPASELDGRVHSRVIVERSRRLRELAAQKALQFRRRFVGRRLDAVALGSEGERALTGNFIDVKLQAPGGTCRRSAVGLVDVELTSANEEGATARWVGHPSWATPAPGSLQVPEPLEGKNSTV
ncbi:MAG: tRNA (N(6)-L-threonylcarbamoyladenosine(37)-C(2))-methylthiotransferase MtaB [Acidobacteriota bacterium]|nr:tRNA (N(6)-L-threonylcarbamoyladenosine(37)-C(2))-methylthiotransferase MtaB [Acidobacteriota bacterium]